MLISQWSALGVWMRQHQYFAQIAYTDSSFLCFQIAIIEACQIYNSANASTAARFNDASRGPREDSTDIILCRKHSYLLLSSVIGGASVREAYTGALAEQFQMADGKTDIFQMTRMAKLQMQKRHPECKNQVPETRETLMKNLVLPPKLA